VLALCGLLALLVPATALAGKGLKTRFVVTGQI
jgi:hypothetical protein